MPPGKPLWTKFLFKNNKINEAFSPKGTSCRAPPLCLQFSRGHLAHGLHTDGSRISIFDCHLLHICKMTLPIWMIFPELRYDLLLRGIKLSLLARQKTTDGFLKNIILFIYDCAGSWLLCGLFSSCRQQELLSSCCVQASHQGSFSFSGAWAPECSGFRSCGMWAQELWCTGLVALRHVRSSQIRDQILVSCIGRRILYHWVSREALQMALTWQFSLLQGVP